MVKDYGRYMLLLLSLLFIIKGILWSVATPLWQAPDEFGHFGYIQHLAERGEMPILGKTRISKEILSSFSYMDTFKIMFKPEKKQRLQGDVYVGEFENNISELKRLRGEDSDIINYMAMHPPFYYLLLSLIYKIFSSLDLINIAFLLRLSSIIIGLITLIVSYQITKEIFPGDKLFWTMTPVILAFHPMFTFISSVISNDNLVTMLFSLYLLSVIKGIKNGLSYSLSTVLGLILGTGMLTKISFAIGFPLYLIALAFIYKIGLNNLRSLLLNGLITISISLIFIIPLLIFNLSNNGVLLLNNTPYLLELGNTPVITNQVTIDLLIGFFQKFFYNKMPDTYIGVFGNLDTRMPDPFYFTFKIVLLISFIGIIYYLYRTGFQKEKERSITYSFWFIILSVIVSVAFFFWLDLSFLLKYNFPSLQGRHLFIIIIPQILIMTKGLMEIFPKRYQSYYIRIFPLYFVIMNITSLLFSVIPRYYMEGSF